MTTTDVRLSISLEHDHCAESAKTAWNLYVQMSDARYDLMSVQPCPLTIDQWRDENRTARKRANRAFGRGYRAHALYGFGGLEFDEVNQSTAYRQGRPMSAGYRLSTTWADYPDYPCPRHATRATGIYHEDALVAYLVMIRAGELALVSQILGHADHLENEIMYLLFQSALVRECVADPECLVVYNRHDSGTDGLRFFKERLGFQEMPVEWLP